MAMHNPSEIENMYKCQDCTFSTNWISNLKRPEKGMHQKHVLNQNYTKDTVFSNNSRNHVNGIHNEGELNQNYYNILYTMNQDSIYDVRLKENFKVFISGPSRSGKTVFVSNL